MKTALIIGDSGGIGRALRQALSAQGVDVTGLSRSKDGFDILDEAAVEDGLKALTRRFDMILITTGGLEIDGVGPEKSIKAISAEAMARQMALNAIGPALVLRHVGRLLRKDGRGVCAVLSARVGSIGDNRLGGWISYRAAKAALNQIVHTTAIELARSHPHALCVALHPGTVQTDLTAKYAKGHATVTPDQAADHLLSVMAGLQPDDTGGFFDWAGKRIVW